MHTFYEKRVDGGVVFVSCGVCQGAGKGRGVLVFSFAADHSWCIAGPTAGIKPLRVAVANLYNAHHRKGKKSQYTWENVCIVPGGRAGLIRIAAVINNAYLGFFIPDYTAYNEASRLVPCVIGDEKGKIRIF